MPKGFTFFLLKFKKLLCFRLGESLFLSVMATGRSIRRLEIWFNILFVCINFPVFVRLHCCLGFESAPQTSRTTTLWSSFTSPCNISQTVSLASHVLQSFYFLLPIYIALTPLESSLTLLSMLFSYYSYVLPYESYKPNATAARQINRIQEYSGKIVSGAVLRKSRLVFDQGISCSIAFRPIQSQNSTTKFSLRLTEYPKF